MDRLTPLEVAVLAALADELSSQAPDLAAQVEAASPGLRRVTPEGLSTEIIVDRHRPAPRSGPTGRLGTVHADVAPLQNPVAFQAEFVAGRLIGFTGAPYGEDATAVDWARARPEGLFTIDASGESVAWVPPRLASEDSALQALQNPAAPASEPAPADPVAPNLSEAWVAVSDWIFGPRDPASAPPPPPPPDNEQHVSWIIGVWVIAAAGVAVASLFGAPVVATGVFALIAASRLQSRRAHHRIQRVWAVLTPRRS